MAKTRQVERDTRDYDNTQLKTGTHGKTLHRDYTAHFFRWAFARRFITAKDHVLEIGCGEERPLSKILTGGAAAHVNTYVGVDINKLKSSDSQRLTFLGEFNAVERWKELQKLRPEGYDVIVHYEVIEHMKVEHGAKLLTACYNLLRPGGVMLMSTPCYDGKRHAANHIHEYTVPELQKAVEKAKLTVEKRFGTFMDLKHLKATSDAMKAIKGEDAGLASAIVEVSGLLSQYFDSDAISNIFGPLFPDHARNNLWICRKLK